MTRSLLLKQPQTQNTQDAAVARSEEVGNFARGVASNKLSRIWAPAGKCKRKPFSSTAAKGDKAERPRELLEFIGSAGSRVCPQLTWEMGAQESLCGCREQHLCCVKRSLIMQFMSGMPAAWEPASRCPWREKGNCGQILLLITPLPWLQCFCIISYRKKDHISSLPKCLW